MTGIFQLFDRQHVLTEPRINHKTLPPGNSHFNENSLERDSSSKSYGQASVVGSKSNAGKKIKQGPQRETKVFYRVIKISFSSSCSSNLSSMECKKAQPEGSSDRIVFPENPSRGPVMNVSFVFPHLGRQSFDFRDVVKDSMYRESRRLPVKTIKEEAASAMIKHKDTPRRSQLSKSVNESYGADIDGSALRVLGKLRDTPWYDNEARELARSSNDVKDGAWHSLPKVAPRFSQDGRDTRRFSYESPDTIKPTPKLNELPRLSLDNREGSMRNSSSDSKISQFPKNFQNGGNSNEKISNVTQFSWAQKRPPGVVAKLMGLEALPDSSMAANNEAGYMESSLVGAQESFSRSRGTNDLNMGSTNSNSSKFSMKDSTSPRWKRSDFVMRPVSSSRFPIEPAPWKQQPGYRGSQKASFRTVKQPTRTPDSFPSIYGEIEKRLKDIEFKQSGRDLRALKQILESMQAKGLLDTTKEEQGSNLASEKTYEPCRSSNQSLKSVRKQKSHINQSISRRVRGSDMTRALESPIVIMKSAKRVDRARISGSAAIPVEDLSSPNKIQSGGYQDNKKASAKSLATRDQSPQSDCRDAAAGTNDKKTSTRNVRAIQFQSKSSQLSKENNHFTVKNSGSVSPRLQRKKLELEKRYRPPTPLSDSSKPRRVPDKQARESASPGGKRRPKYQNKQSSDDQLSEISSDSISLSCHGDDTSLLPDHIAFSDLNLDEEIASKLQSSKINGSQSPSLETKCSVSGSMQKNSTQKLVGDGSVVELATNTPEQPSPVSVLDTSIYRDESPSSAKHISHDPEAHVNLQSKATHDESQWNTENKLSSNGIGPGLTLEINRKKLQNIENLVQKLRQLNSSHDEAKTDYIASLCENTNPDRRYVTEILLASGLLLRDLGSKLMTFQLHHSGHPINPELFFVLEQTKASSTLLQKEERTSGYSKSNPAKHHRKLVFDTVNEILGVKLSSLASSFEPWLKHIKLARTTLTAQKLLKELCSEVELIQSMKSVCALGGDDSLRSVLWEDVMHRSDSWTEFHNEMPVVILDVERLIFKDLVDEIVIGEAPGLLLKPSRRSQLFAQQYL